MVVHITYLPETLLDHDFYKKKKSKPDEQSFIIVSTDTNSLKRTGTTSHKNCSNCVYLAFYFFFLSFFLLSSPFRSQSRGEFSRVTSSSFYPIRSHAGPCYLFRRGVVVYVKQHAGKMTNVKIVLPHYTLIAAAFAC